MKQNFTVRKGALDGVEAFLSVAQHRNFRRAAADLGVTPSAISQAIRALEARVGAALFIRTTRSVGLTEAGERFLSRAKPAFEELVAASEVARDLGQRPAGLLRLSVPRAVVPLLLEPLIASFCQAYPEIELEIAASGEMVDLAAGGFDAGIRLGQFIDPDMTAVRLTPPFPLVVVGSPDYLRGRKRPERIDDLRGHACLRMRRSNGSIAPWPFVDGNKTVEAHRLRAAHRAGLPVGGQFLKPRRRQILRTRSSISESNGPTMRSAAIAASPHSHSIVPGGFEVTS
jgi:DNA-binding transcriptional LysR family regulator